MDDQTHFRGILNHNESAASDRRTTEPSGATTHAGRAVAALALAAAAALPLSLATATPAHSSGNCTVSECGTNHNESAARERPSSEGHR